MVCIGQAFVELPQAEECKCPACQQWRIVRLQLEQGVVVRTAFGKSAERAEQKGPKPERGFIVGIGRNGLSENAHRLGKFLLAYQLYGLLDLGTCRRRGWRTGRGWRR